MTGGKALAPSRRGSERAPAHLPVRVPLPERSDRGLLLDLQRQAGNRAVARLVRSVAQRTAQRKAGWSDADREGTGYNTGERAVGAMRRIPIEGLTGGYQGAGEGEIRLGKTDESAGGRAVVVVPAGLAPGKPVDILLHLHGYTGRAVDPYAGWRQRKSDQAVRDVALDRIEQQLEGTGNAQLIAVLPQGAGKSDFGRLNPDTYIAEVLDRLTAVGAVTGKLKLGHVLLSAHSGGGHTVKRLLDSDLRPAGKRTGPALPAQLGQLMLYDAINSDNELATVRGWVEAQLDRARTVLADPAVPAAGKEAYLASSPRFVGYYASYAERYRKLDRAIGAWFDRHAGDLGGYAGPLRNHFQVHAAKGLSHEEVIRGRARGDNAKPGEGNLASAVRSYYHPAGSAPPPHAAITPSTGGDPFLAAGELTRVLGIAPQVLASWMVRVGGGADPVAAAISCAAAVGYRDEVQLTDLVFGLRHPELNGGRIPAGDPALTREWREIRRGFVRPAVRAAASAPAVPPAHPAAPAAPAVVPRPAAAPPPTAVAKPTVVAKPAAAGPAAGALTAEQRAKLIQQAVDQATAKDARDKLAAGGKLKAKDKVAISASDAIAKDLRDCGTTVEAWFAGMEPEATFLGLPIRKSGGVVQGVHRELLTVLRRAERTLLDRYPGKTPRQVASALGVYDIAGLRPPKNATGGTRPSMHCYGMAVDINYAGNPFIGQPRKPKHKGEAPPPNPQTEMVERATLLMSGSAFTISKAPHGLGKKDLDDSEAARAARAKRADESWQRFHTASEAVQAYLSLTDSELAKRIAGNGYGHDLAWWTERLAEDRKVIGHGEFAGHTDPSKAGFMDLSEKLVEVLVHAGLSWGGCYATGKDLMHFDLRTGTITGRDVL